MHGVHGTPARAPRSSLCSGVRARPRRWRIRGARRPGGRTASPARASSPGRAGLAPAPRSRRPRRCSAGAGPSARPASPAASTFAGLSSSVRSRARERAVELDARDRQVAQQARSRRSRCRSRPCGCRRRGRAARRRSSRVRSQRASSTAVSVTSTTRRRRVDAVPLEDVDDVLAPPAGGRSARRDVHADGPGQVRVGREQRADLRRAPGGRSSTMSPESSATGRKSPGYSSPRSGCCQRTSASCPTTARVRRGGRSAGSGRRTGARRSRAAARPRWSAGTTAWACMSSSKKCHRARPASLARNSAESVSRSRLVGVEVGGGHGDADRRRRARCGAARPSAPRMAALSRSATISTLVLARHVGHDDDELVAAEPADAVVGRRTARDALRDVRQHVVAGDVTERVVDDLEVVEVDEHHAEPRARAARRRAGRHRACRGPRPGCQPGQGVVERPVASSSCASRSTVTSTTWIMNEGGASSALATLTAATLAHNG